MRRNFKYRVYPTKAQAEKFETTLGLCCELYNAALQERIEAYKLQRISLSVYDQIKELPDVKSERGDLRKIYAQVLQDVLRRLDKAFQIFFARVKSGKGKAGFPRFRLVKRHDSFTYPQGGFWVGEKSIVLSKIGEVRCKFHRKIEGVIKTCTIKRESDEWYVVLSCDAVPEKPLPKTGEEIGIDVGLENFAALSNGEMIENPHHAKKARVKLRRAQRKLSRAKKGSKRRKKQVQRVAKQHLKVKRQRRDFHFKVAAQLVHRFDVIHFEKLNIRNMVRNHRLSFSISDAAWFQFQQIVAFKAEEAGKQVTRNDARNTSNECSVSGEVKKKPLSQRFHVLPSGEKIHRDHNAAGACHIGRVEVVQSHRRRRCRDKTCRRNEILNINLEPQP